MAQQPVFGASGQFAAANGGKGSSEPARPSVTILLGSNVIHNCQSVLIVNDKEVFRLREGQSNHQLLCDFDVHREDGQRIAKIAKNQVVYAAPGYTYHATPNRAEVIDGNGNAVASVDRIDATTLKIKGAFHVDGYTATITDDAIEASNFHSSGSYFDGLGTAISIGPGQILIG